jgi:hypothetical protein
MLIPIRWHGYKDFPCTDINSRCIRFQYGTIFQAHPFSFAGPVCPYDLGLFFSGFFGCFCLDMRLAPFAQTKAKSRKLGTLLKGISLGTAAGCNHCMAHGTWDHASDRAQSSSTTELSAYFLCLCAYRFDPDRWLAPSSSPVWPRHRARGF